MRKYGAVALAGTLAALALAACGTGGEAATVTDDGRIIVKVGFPNDLSGVNVSAGEHQRMAAVIAAEHINGTDSGVKIELDVEDTKSKPAAAVSAIQSMTADDDLDVVVGLSFTGEALAVSPLLARSGIPTVYLQVTDMTGAGDNMVSLARPGKNQLDVLVDGAFEGKVGSVALIRQEVPTFTANMDDLRASIRAAGIEIVADIGGSQEQTDFGPQITQAVRGNPDAVIIQALTPQTATMVTNLRSAGYRGEIIGYQNIGDPAFRATAGKAAEGVQYTTYWDPAVANDEAKRFLDAYTTAYPKEPPPDVFAMQAWDALHIVAKAVKQVGSTDRGKVAAAIRGGTFPAGAQDQISFDDDGFADLRGYVVRYTADATEAVVD